LECAVPELQSWGEKAQAIATEWYPRLANLLPTEGMSPPRTVTIEIKRSRRGVASTSGTVIHLSSHWFEQHPDDVGAVVHEVVHVIQSYRHSGPGWLTEGIADYLRWAIYEGKPQSWFPRSKKPKGYEEGYRVTAGFLLWLEGGRSPGIVKRLNTAMRRGAYRETLFKELCGEELDELWNEYQSLAH